MVRLYRASALLARKQIGGGQVSMDIQDTEELAGGNTTRRTGWVFAFKHSPAWLTR